MLAREEASFSVGRESSVGRIKRVRLEDSIGSEQNRMTCKTGKTQFIRQSDAIPKLKAIWAFFKGIFLCGSAGTESACNAGDLGSILSWEDPLEKGRTTYSSILT